MTGLPSYLIKKYGISKKAWSVFRSGHSGSRRKASGAGGHMGKKKKKFGSTGRSNKASGALFAVGAMALALLAGVGVSTLYKRFTKSGGIVKHGVTFATTGPLGAVGGAVDDFTEGRGLDLSMQMPSFGAGSRTTSAKTGGATFY